MGFDSFFFGGEVVYMKGEKKKRNKTVIPIIRIYRFALK